MISSIQSSGRVTTSPQVSAYTARRTRAQVFPLFATTKRSRSESVETGMPAMIQVLLQIRYPTPHFIPISQAIPGPFICAVSRLRSRHARACSSRGAPVARSPQHLGGVTYQPPRRACDSFREGMSIFKIPTTNSPELAWVPVGP